MLMFSVVVQMSGIFRCADAAPVGKSDGTVHCSLNVELDVACGGRLRSVAVLLHVNEEAPLRNVR